MEIHNRPKDLKTTVIQFGHYHVSVILKFFEGGRDDQKRCAKEWYNKKWAGKYCAVET